MHPVSVAILGALAVCACLPVTAAEQSAELNLRPDESYNAKWNGCEALAIKRGTPPGTSSYGDFIEGCVRKATLNQPRVTRRTTNPRQSSAHP
jgi:hypothetical protein